MTLLEVAANAMVTVSIVLAGRNSIHTWWTGIVGCALFAVLFDKSRLYADVALQLFFVITSAIGWWQWRAPSRQRAATVVHTSRRLMGLAVLVGAACALGYGWLLHRFTDAYAPFVDSTVLAFSVIGQVLLMQRRVENWPLWVLVNTIAVPLYASRELYLTAFLYAAYWVNAVVSWRHWHRLAALPVTTAEVSS